MIVATLSDATVTGGNRLGSDDAPLRLLRFWNPRHALHHAPPTHGRHWYLLTDLLSRYPLLATRQPDKHISELQVEERGSGTSGRGELPQHFHVGLIRDPDHKQHQCL